jgi:antirestriction protein ArdC
MQNAQRQDLYTCVTAKIIASLEQGARPWVKPWNSENTAGWISRPLRHNGTPYSGINILMLWGAAMELGFTSPTWMTFRQALALNAHVKKGAKGSLVVYADTFTANDEDENGQECDRQIPFLKGYTVFNIEQIEGLPEHYYATPQPRFTAIERIAHADAFFAATQADIRYGGSRAYYSQDGDYIQMPPIESFRDAEDLYGTLAHECIHYAASKIMPR